MPLKNTPEKLIFGRRATKGGKFSTAKSDVKLANRDTVQQESLIGVQRVERDPDEVCMVDIDLYMNGGYRFIYEWWISWISKWSSVIMNYAVRSVPHRRYYSYAAAWFGRR